MTPNEQPDAAVKMAEEVQRIIRDVAVVWGNDPRFCSENEQAIKTLVRYIQQESDRLTALQSHNETLRRALEFYAGRVREDGNGYGFDREDFRGERARQALAATPAEQREPDTELSG